MTRILKQHTWIKINSNNCKPSKRDQLPRSQNQAFNIIHGREPVYFIGNSSSLYSIISPIIDNRPIFFFIICQNQCIITLRKAQWEQSKMKFPVVNIVIYHLNILHLNTLVTNSKQLSPWLSNTKLLHLPHNKISSQQRLLCF